MPLQYPAPALFLIGAEAVEAFPGKIFVMTEMDKTLVAQAQHPAVPAVFAQELVALIKKSKDGDSSNPW